MGVWFDWTSIGIGVGGLVASIAGLTFAYLARRAAKSAEAAANEARHSISQTLCLVSAQRAISVVARIRTLHQEQRWDAALELYQELRTLLNDVSGTLPREFIQSRPEFDRRIGQLGTIQSLVRESVSSHGNPSEFRFLNESLNSIEITLETLVSTIMPPSEREGELDG